MLTNEKSCGEQELLASLDSYCGVPDMFTRHGSFYSNDEGQFWCDTCGRGLGDLGSLTQHVSEHNVDSIANTNDTHGRHTSHAGLLSNQEHVIDDDGKTKLGDTRLGIMNICLNIVNTNNN